MASATDEKAFITEAAGTGPEATRNGIRNEEDAGKIGESRVDDVQSRPRDELAARTYFRKNQLLLKFIS